MDASLIARVTHEADRAFLATQGDLTQKTWFALDAWQRTSVIHGVKAALALPDANAAQLHAGWLRDKSEQGWEFGPSFDLDAKRDPLMVPWAQLSTQAQRRDAMFLGVVRALSI